MSTRRCAWLLATFLAVLPRPAEARVIGLSWSGRQSAATAPASGPADHEAWAELDIVLVPWTLVEPALLQLERGEPAGGPPVDGPTLARHLAARDADDASPDTMLVLYPPHASRALRVVEVLHFRFEAGDDGSIEADVGPLPAERAGLVAVLAQPMQRLRPGSPREGDPILAPYFRRFRFDGTALTLASPAHPMLFGTPPDATPIAADRGAGTPTWDVPLQADRFLRSAVRYSPLYGAVSAEALPPIGNRITLRLAAAYDSHTEVPLAALGEAPTLPPAPPEPPGPQPTRPNWGMLAMLLAASVGFALFLRWAHGRWRARREREGRA